MKILLSIAFAAVLSAPALAQPAWESVPFRGLSAPDHYFCLPDENNSISASELDELWKHERCAKLPRPDVDFSKEELFAYHAGGDCHMRLMVDVLLNHTEKKYRIEIVNIWGGCRASGRRSGWIVIERIPEGYEFEFEEIQIGERAFSKDPDVLRIRSGKIREKLLKEEGR